MIRPKMLVHFQLLCRSIDLGILPAGIQYRDYVSSETRTHPTFDGLNFNKIDWNEQPQEKAE